MSSERGLPTVPRGLSRELSLYLQSLQNVILSLSGLGRGTQESKAIRAEDAAKLKPAAPLLRKGAVLTYHLANECVTSEKLADDCIVEKKIAPSAVTARAIMAGAVGSDALSAFCVNSGKLAASCVNADKLADNSISLEKLGNELIPSLKTGKAEDGETVEIGSWFLPPSVALAGIEIELAGEGTLSAGIENLRLENGIWQFEAVAKFETEDSSHAGKIMWIATGTGAANG